MVPVLRERAARAEHARTITPETHRAFVEAGLYRILQPARYEGYEFDLGALVDIAAELGRGCGFSPHFPNPPWSARGRPAARAGKPRGAMPRIGQGA